MNNIKKWGETTGLITNLNYIHGEIKVEILDRSRILDTMWIDLDDLPHVAVEDIMRIVCENVDSIPNLVRYADGYVNGYSASTKKSIKKWDADSSELHDDLRNAIQGYNVSGGEIAHDLLDALIDAVNIDKATDLLFDILKGKGLDLEDEYANLSMRKSTGVPDLTERYPEGFNPPSERIEDYEQDVEMSLTERGGPMSEDEILHSCYGDDDKIIQAISNLIEYGVIRQLDDGTYVLAGSDDVGKSITTGNSFSDMVSKMKYQIGKVECKVRR